MTKTLWIQVALIFLGLVLMVASNGGGGGKSSKGSDRESGRSRRASHESNKERNQNPDHTGNTEGKQNPSHGGNTGSNWNPSNMGNTGSDWNPSRTGNSGGNWNLQEPANPGSNWNPPGSWQNKQSKSKTNMKSVASAGISGGVGGFMLGNPVSNMRYNFGNDMDSRYYNSHQSQMPNRVYRPMYEDNSRMSENRFVSDCYNMSMTEYVIKPNEGKNVIEIDQTEVRVKSTVIRQLCVNEYKRGNIYLMSSGINLLFSPGLLLSIMLFVYFVVE